jgi:hypothetical protein
MLCVLFLFSNRLKLHQIFGDEHLAGKVFLYLLGLWHVIAVSLVRQVRQDDGLDIGACGHLPDHLQGHMSLGHLPHDAGIERLRSMGSWWWAS